MKPGAAAAAATSPKKMQAKNLETILVAEELIVAVACGLLIHFSANLRAYIMGHCVNLMCTHFIIITTTRDLACFVTIVQKISWTIKQRNQIC